MKVRYGAGSCQPLAKSKGVQVVSYTYDTWGQVASITGTQADTIGEKKPYRYRGYRYDSETGLYYLNARYYNPEMGRFLNADSFGGTSGELISHNAFAFMKNNPFMYVDPTGYAPEWLSFAVDFIPVVGNFKSAYEAVMGADPMTGRKLSTGDRWWATGRILYGGLKKGKYVKKFLVRVR